MTLLSCLSPPSGAADGNSSKHRNSSSVKYSGDPTVVEMKNFNAEKDAIALYHAMKGAGTDEATVINIICARSYKQLREIDVVYQQLYGQLLQTDLKDDLGGNFEKVVLALFLSNTEHDVETIKDAIKGAGTDESAIIEILCTRSNFEIEEIKALYKKRTKNELVKDLMGDTSGDFKRIVVSLCSASRDESGASLCRSEAASLAKLLYDKGEGQRGTNEVEFNKIFCRRGFHQLREIFNEYKKLHEDGIEDTVKGEFSGATKDAYMAISVTALYGREMLFAQKLHSSMKGLGTNDDQLIRLMVSRSRQDLKTVAKKFQEKYENSLESFIEGDCSGEYKTALLSLLKGNN